MSFLSTFKNLEANKLKNFIILFLVALLFWISFTSLLPVLPVYIQELGGTPKQVGLVMGTFAVGLLFSRIWLGKLADQHSRKIVILIGTVLATIAPLLYLNFNAIHHLMIIRGLQGISLASLTIGYSALIVDLSPTKHKGELIGYMSLAAPIGLAIGPASGSYLQQYAGYQTLFIVSFVCGLIAFILTNLVQENRSNIDQDNQTNNQLTQEIEVDNSLRNLYFKSSLVIPAIVLLIIGTIFSCLVTFLPLYILELKIDFNIGSFYSVAAISSFIIRFTTGKASDNYGRGLFLTLSMFSYLICLILILLSHSVILFLIAGIIKGMGDGIIFPISTALISDRCSVKNRGKVLSFCFTGFDLGIAMGGYVLGGYVEFIGYNGIFAIAMGMTIIALSLFMTLSNRNLISSFRFSLGKSPDLYKL